MRFSTRALTTAFMAASSALSTVIQPQAPKLTSGQVVTGLNGITAYVQNLTKAAQTNPLGPPSIGAPAILTGLQGIVSSIKTVNTAIGNTPTLPYNAAGQQAVCSALSSLTTALSQNLLGVVIGNDILEALPLGSLTTVLTSLGAALTTLVYSLLSLIPSCVWSALSELANLNGTVGQAICAHTIVGSVGLGQNLIPCKNNKKKA